MNGDKNRGKKRDYDRSGRPRDESIDRESNREIAWIDFFASCSSLRSKGVSFEKHEGNSKVRVVSRVIDRTGTGKCISIDRMIGRDRSNYRVDPGGWLGRELEELPW